MLTVEQVQAIRKLFADGASYGVIGRQFGVSRQRVQQIVRPSKDLYDAVKSRANGMCEVCGIKVSHGHVHHCDRQQENRHETLQYLCPSCHREREIYGKSYALSGEEPVQRLVIGTVPRRLVIRAKEEAHKRKISLRTFMLQLLIGAL